MTPEQALNLLYQYARLAPLPATEHEKVVTATKALHDLIKSIEVPEAS